METIGELLDKRTRNAKHFLLEDGSFQAIIGGGDVHYEDEQGNWHDIQTDLFDEADFDAVDIPVSKHKHDSFHARKQIITGAKAKGPIDRTKFDYHALQVPFAATIPRQFRKGYSIGKGENKLTFKPVGASLVIGQQKVDGRNTIEYQDAWHSTDVTLQLTDRGIKETIVLKTSLAPSTFSFEVVGVLADDLTAGELRLSPAWLEDANGVRRDVAQTVRRVGAKTFVDLMADVSGLVYPVVIDPTVVTLQPPSETDGMDTYISSTNPNNNYSGATFMRDGSAASPSTEVFRGLIKFDVSSVPGGIISATMSLYLGFFNGSPYLQLAVREALADWTESTVTWSTQPPMKNVDVYATALPFSSNASYIDMDVTTAAINWKTTNYGLFLASTGSTGDGIYGEFQSSGGANKPKLTINYNLSPGTTQVIIQPDATAGKDTFIQSGYPSSNNATSTFMEIGTPNSSTVERALLQFDLGAIPANVKILSAILTLTGAGVGNANFVNAMAAYMITGTWTETGVTWATQPPYDAVNYKSPTISIYDSSGGKKFEFDITTMTDRWFKGLSANNGLMFVGEEITTSTHKALASSDDTTVLNRPKLTVTYQVTPTVITPNGGETWNAQHTITWTAVTDSEIYDFAVLQNDFSTNITDTIKEGQTFKTGNAPEKLTKVRFSMATNYTGTNLYVSLYATDGTLPTTLISQVVMPNHVSSSVNEANFPNVQLSPNTTYAIIFENAPTFNMQGFKHANTNANGTRVQKNSTNPWSVMSADDLSIEIVTVPSLQYHIQLSPDNGGTWHDIVALTAAGATSLSYNFTSETESTQAKIRIRAYDGVSYGAWDESNAVFTITHRFGKKLWGISSPAKVMGFTAKKIYGIK